MRHALDFRLAVARGNSPFAGSWSGLEQAGHRASRFQPRNRSLDHRKNRVLRVPATDDPCEGNPSPVAERPLGFCLSAAKLSSAARSPRSTIERTPSFGTGVVWSTRLRTSSAASARVASAGRLIARPIQVDGAGSTSIDLLASRISMVDVSETQEIGFILVRMKVLSASTSSTRMRRM
jgi:hypothetical protein